MVTTVNNNAPVNCSAPPDDGGGKLLDTKGLTPAEIAAVNKMIEKYKNDDHCGCDGDTGAPAPSPAPAPEHVYKDGRPAAWHHRREEIRQNALNSGGKQISDNGTQTGGTPAPAPEHVYKDGNTAEWHHERERHRQIAEGAANGGTPPPADAPAPAPHDAAWHARREEIRQHAVHQRRSDIADKAGTPPPADSTTTPPPADVNTTPPPADTSTTPPPSSAMPGSAEEKASAEHRLRNLGLADHYFDKLKNDDGVITRESLRKFLDGGADGAEARAARELLQNYEEVDAADGKENDGITKDGIAAAMGKKDTDGQKFAVAERDAFDHIWNAGKYMKDTFPNEFSDDDSKITPQLMEDILASKDVPPDLRSALEFLKANPDALAKLDTANGGAADQSFSLNDIKSAMNGVGEFIY